MQGLDNIAVSACVSAKFLTQQRQYSCRVSMLNSCVCIQAEEKVSSHKDKPSAPAQEAGVNAPSATPSTAPPTAGMGTPRNTAGLTRQGSGRAGGTPKPKDTPKTALKGASRSSKKTVPASFVEVIDCLVDVTLRYKGMQPGEEADLAEPVVEAMETDEPFSVSAQLPDGRMVTVSASQPARASAAAAAQPGAASGSGQGLPAIKATFTEQVGLHRDSSTSFPFCNIDAHTFAASMGKRTL